MTFTWKLQIKSGDWHADWPACERETEFETWRFSKAPSVGRGSILCILDCPSVFDKVIWTVLHFEDAGSREPRPRHTPSGGEVVLHRRGTGSPPVVDLGAQLNSMRGAQGVPRFTVPFAVPLFCGMTHICLEAEETRQIADSAACEAWNQRMAWSSAPVLAPATEGSLV
jgi:hypothetical protein